MIVALWLTAALLAGPPPTVAHPLTRTAEGPGGVRLLELALGDSVVLVFDDGLRPTIQSTAPADPAAVTPELQGRTLAGDPHPFNHAAPGTVRLTLAASGTGTRLLAENGLDRPLRMHADALRSRADGNLGGGSTTLCPAKPGVGDIENWPNPIDALLFLRFEYTMPDDNACTT